MQRIANAASLATNRGSNALSLIVKPALEPDTSSQVVLRIHRSERSFWKFWQIAELAGNPEDYDGIGHAMAECEPKGIRL